MALQENYVELRGLNKNYGNFRASNNVSFAIARGKLVALLGPSGSGKTTILRMIAGLEHPDSGEVLIDGKVMNDVPGNERGIGFVFQSYALFRYMTVFDNIAFGLRLKKAPKQEVADRVHELLKLINCEGLEKRFPSQLSGGQRQRVAFARALAPRPSLLLLDEPFAAIDAKVRLELRSWLRRMISSLNITSIFVTHDQEEAIEVADEIIVTNQGRVEQVGPPTELYSNPQTPFVASFIGRPERVDNYGDFQNFDSLGTGSYALVRPEFVSVFKEGENKQYLRAAEEGIVEDVVFRGNLLEIRVKVRNSVIPSVRSIVQPFVSVGERVGVLVHRLMIVHGDNVDLIQNRAITSESVVI